MKVCSFGVWLVFVFVAISMVNAECVDEYEYDTMTKPWEDFSSCAEEKLTGACTNAALVKGCQKTCGKCTGDAIEQQAALEADKVEQQDAWKTQAEDGLEKMEGELSKANNVAELKTIAQQAEGEEQSIKTEDTESENENHAEEDVKWKDQAENGLKQMESELSKADNVGELKTIAEQAKSEQEAMETKDIKLESENNEAEYQNDSEEQGDESVEEKLQAEEAMMNAEKKKLEGQQLKDFLDMQNKMKAGGKESEQEATETKDIKLESENNEAEYQKDSEEQGDESTEEKLQADEDLMNAEKKKLEGQQLKDFLGMQKKLKAGGIEGGDAYANEKRYTVDGNGVQVCEKQDGLGKGECNRIVCCKYSDDDNMCKSTVGEKSCESAENNGPGGLDSEPEKEDTSSLSKSQLADRKWLENNRDGKLKQPEAKVEADNNAEELCGSEYFQTNEDECNALVCCSYAGGKCASTVGSNNCNSAYEKQKDAAKYDATAGSTKGLTEQQIADMQGGDEAISPAAENTYAMAGTGKAVCESSIAELSETECKALVCCAYTGGKCVSTVGDEECSSAEKEETRAPTTAELAAHPEWQQADNEEKKFEETNGKTPAEALTKEDPTGTGEQECPKVGMNNEAECRNVGCCTYDNNSGACTSAVGDDKCIQAEVHSAEEVQDARAKLATMEAELKSAYNAKDLEHVASKAEETEDELQNADHEKVEAAQERRKMAHGQQQQQQSSAGMSTQKLRSASTGQPIAGQPPSFDPLTITALVLAGVGVFVYFSGNSKDQGGHKYQSINTGYQQSDPTF